MTTIVTTTGSNTCAVYADSGLTSELIHPDIHKITTQGNWLIASAGDGRQCDILHYQTKYPKPPTQLLTKSREHWHSWIVNKVIPNIAKGLPGNDYDFELLLVTHAKAFYVASSLSVSDASPYWALGTGSQLAIGYLASAQYDDNWNRDHDLKAKYAVSISMMHDPFTRGEIKGYVSYHTGHLVRG